jgi:hypothetical protein
MEMLAVEQGVRCTVGACGLCVERECTARLDGIIPGDFECPGYLAHKMINPDAIMRLRRSGNESPQDWWPIPAGEAGGTGPWISGALRAC